MYLVVMRLVVVNVISGSHSRRSVMVGVNQRTVIMVQGAGVAANGTRVPVVRISIYHSSVG